MRIVYISKYVGFADSPAPTRQYFLARALARLGCTMLLVGSRSNGQREPGFAGLSRTMHEPGLTSLMLNGAQVGLGLNPRRLLSWLWFELALWLKIGVLRRFRPDVVIVSSLSFLTLLSGVLLKRVLGARLVVEVRDIYPLTLVEVGGFSPRNPLVRAIGWIERLAYRRADLLISPLERFDRHAAAVLGHPVDVVWLPMGFDPEFYAPRTAPPAPAGEAALAAIAAAKAAGKFVIVYAGTIGVANALEPLFAAADRTRADGIQYVFVGDGPMAADYRARYAGRDDIAFFGRIPKADVLAVLRAGDLLVNLWLDLPIYRFGVSPNKWIDYALAGRPFVTNVPADLAVVREMHNAIVVTDVAPDALAAKLREIAAWPRDRLTALGEAGRQHLVDNRSYDTLAGKLLAALPRPRDVQPS